MEARFWSGSSDGSDGFFVEEPFYHGMLRATDHRKGGNTFCFQMQGRPAVLVLVLWWSED